MTLRDVGGMVYFLFALVLFAALTNITAMDNDGRMPSLPSMDPGAAVEVGSAATVRPVMFSGLLAATRAAAEISAEYVSQLAREALVENGLNAASLPATTLSSIAAAAAVAAAGIRRNFPGSIPASFSLLKVPLLDCARRTTSEGFGNEFVGATPRNPHNRHPSTMKGGDLGLRTPPKQVSYPIPMHT